MNGRSPKIPLYEACYQRLTAETTYAVLDQTEAGDNRPFLRIQPFVALPVFARGTNAYDVTLRLSAHSTAFDRKEALDMEAAIVAAMQADLDLSGSSWKVVLTEGPYLDGETAAANPQTGQTERLAVVRYELNLQDVS